MRLTGRGVMVVWEGAGRLASLCDGDRGTPSGRICQ